MSDQAGPETDTPSTPSADCWGEASGGDGCAPFPLSDVSDLSDQAGPETDTPPKPYTDCWGEASGGDGCAPFPLPDLSDLSDESGLLDWARYQPEKPDPQCKTDGECLAFDDGDLCNGVPTCLAGKCMFDPGTIVQCVGDGTPCAVKVCLPETGTCAATAAEDGAACSDGNPLTPVDLCVAGKCVGTGITSCTTNGQCNDLYPCTLDLCIAGKCQHSPTPCLGGKPQDCKMAVCTMTGKCVEKQYAGTDLVIFSEDFFDGLAQGWTYPTPAVLGKLEDGPSGKPGLALTLVPGGSVAVASPLLIVPPMSLVVSIGFESWAPDACASHRLLLKANGLVVADTPLCPFYEQLGGIVAYQVPKGISGVLQLSVTLSNEGASTAKVVLHSFQVEGQGGTACCEDLDQDKRWDCIDNCPGLHNTDQADCDTDGLGDECDPDRDNDGVDNKFDAFPCDPGAIYDVRLVTTRRLDPIEPVAVACGQSEQTCYVFDQSGDHLVGDLQCIPRLMVRFPEVQLVRSATFCGGLLWVLDSGTTVRGYDVSDPARPRVKTQVDLPEGLVSLEQAVTCSNGNLAFSSGHILYVQDVGGGYSELFDVLEEIWSADLTSSVYLTITRSPQPPFLFFLRVQPLGGKQTILPLKVTPEEPTPICQYADMSLAGWGSSHPEGAVWIVVRGCLKPTLQLRDPWHAWIASPDLDKDGLPDLTDPDDDGDGVPDLEDAAPLDAFTVADLDGDGKGNFEDPDDDGDGTSDNYAGLPPVGISEECFFPGVALKGIEVTETGYRLAALTGELIEADFDCNVLQSAPPGFVGLDGLACHNGAECTFHSSTHKGLHRQIAGLWAASLDSPEAALGQVPLNTDLAWSEELLYVGNDSSNQVYALDANGNVRSGLWLPGQFAGIAAVPDRLVILLALSQNASAILRTDRAGRLAGFHSVQAGGLRGLAALDEDSYVALASDPDGTSIVKLTLPPGLVQVEPPPEEIPEEALNPRVAVAPDVPQQTEDGKVLVTWVADPIPDLTAFQVCWICGTVSGYIPQQNCLPATHAAGQLEVAGLPEQKCAFELRASTPEAGTVASRRVSILVNKPGTGTIVWTKVGAQNAAIWEYVAVPTALSLD